MIVRLHVEDLDDMILMVRAAKHVIKENQDSPMRPGTDRATRIIEYENDRAFQVDRTVTGYSVWKAP